MPIVRRIAERVDTAQDAALLRPRRRIVAGVVGLLVPIWSIVALASFQQLDAARSSTLATSATVVKLVEAWALATLGRIDDLAASVEGHLAWGIPARGIQEILERHKTNNPDLFRLTDVLTSDGGILATTAPGHPSHDTRNYDSDSGPTTDVIIGLPRVVADTVLVPMARELRDGAGTAIGTLVAEVDPSYFAGFYGDLGLPPGASVVLFRTDGPLIARNIPSVGSLGRSFPDSPVWRAIEKAPEGSYQALDIDGVRRLVSYRVNGRMPIVVAIGVPDHTVYDQVHDRILITVALTAVLSLAVIAFAVVTVRAVKRRAMIAQALALSAAGVRSVGSGIAILSVTDHAASIVQYNPAFLRLFGTSSASLRERDWTSVAGAGSRAWLPTANETAERHLEAEMTRADGGRFWAEIRAARVRDDDADGAHVVVVVTDISARKDAEAELIGARATPRRPRTGRSRNSSPI